MRGHRRLTGVLALVMVLAMVVAACGDDEGETTTSAGETTTSAGETTTTGAAGEPIKFGMLTGVTGDYSVLYEASQIAADLAIAEINDSGGLLGRPVELVVVDNKSTVEGAVQGFSQLVDVEGVVVLGGMESDAGVANLQAIRDAQIPSVCPGCGTSELDTGIGVDAYMWRTIGSDTDGGIIAAQFARDAGFTRVAVLVQNTEGASAPAEVFKRVFTEVIGGEVIADVRFDPGQSSYQAQVDQAFADDPELVYLGSGFEAAGVILQEWQRRGYSGEWLFSGELIVPEIASLQNQGVEIGDGVGRAALGSYDMSGPAYPWYDEAFEEVAGYPPAPGLYDAYAYDQYIFLALAIVKAGTTDGPAVAAAVPEVLNAPGTECYRFGECLALLEAGEDINYQGISSSLDVNDEGNLVNPTFAEWAIVDGQWTEMGQVVFDEALREGYYNLP